MFDYFSQITPAQEINQHALTTNTEIGYLHNVKTLAQFSNATQVNIQRHNSVNHFAHEHPYIEMVIVLQASGAISIDDRIYPLVTNTLFVIGSHTKHRIDANMNDLVFIVSIPQRYFTAQRLEAVYQAQDRKLLYLLSYYSGKPTFGVFHFKDDMAVQGIQLSLLANYFAEDHLSNQICESELLNLLLRLTQTQRTIVSYEEILGKVSVTDLCHYIDQHYHQISLTKMAQVFGYHPGYINQKLKKGTGHTYTELVALKRINVACELLLTTGAPIVEILRIIGYSNQKQFYTKFQRYTGYTPQQWKKVGHLNH